MHNPVSNPITPRPSFDGEIWFRLKFIGIIAVLLVLALLTSSCGQEKRANRTDAELKLTPEPGDYLVKQGEGRLV